MSYKISVYVKYADETQNTRKTITLDSLTTDNEISISGTGIEFVQPENTATTTIRYVVTDSAGRKLRVYRSDEGAWMFKLPKVKFPTDYTAEMKSAYVPGPLTIRVKYVPKVEIWYYAKNGNTYTKDASPVYVDPWSTHTLSKSGATAYYQMGTPISEGKVKVRTTPIKVAYSARIPGDSAGTGGDTPSPGGFPSGGPTVYDVGEYMADLTENTPTPERVEVEYSAGDVIRLTGIRLAKDIYPEATIEAMISSGGHVGLRYMPGLEVTCYIAENSDEVTLGEPSGEIYQSFADSYESGAPIIVPYDYEGYSESSGSESGSFQLKYVPMGDDLYYVDLNLPEYSEAYSKLGFNIIAYESMEMNGMHLTARAALFNVHPGQLL